MHFSVRTSTVLRLSESPCCLRVLALTIPHAGMLQACLCLYTFVFSCSHSFWRPRGCGLRCCTHASAQAVASPRAPIACCPWLLLCCYTQHLCRCTPSRNALALHAIAFDQPLRRDHEASACRLSVICPLQFRTLRSPHGRPAHQVCLSTTTCVVSRASSKQRHSTIRACTFFLAFPSSSTTAAADSAVLP